MEDLTGKFPTALSFPSMAGGNTIADPAGHKLAMTAPGSESVNPLPDRLDNVIDTAGNPSNPRRIEVNDPLRSGEEASPGPDGSGTWAKAGGWTSGDRHGWTGASANAPAANQTWVQRP